MSTTNWKQFLGEDSGDIWQKFAEWYYWKSATPEIIWYPRRMNEKEWAVCDDPAVMMKLLKFATEKSYIPGIPISEMNSLRKLRLLVCAIASSLYKPPCQGLNTQEELLETIQGIENGSDSNVFYNYGYASPRANRTNEIPIIDALDDNKRQLQVSFFPESNDHKEKCDIIRHIFGYPFKSRWSKTCEHCNGNGYTQILDETDDKPYRRYVIDLPKYHKLHCTVCNEKGFIEREKPNFSSNIINLAEAVYNQEDCAYALRDSLLEEGEVELADHFNPIYESAGICGGYGLEFLDKVTNWHPKGCWVIDTILGRE